jgi:hypothetical protein
MYGTGIRNEPITKKPWTTENAEIAEKIERLNLI